MLSPPFLPLEVKMNLLDVFKKKKVAETKRVVEAPKEEPKTVVVAKKNDPKDSIVSETVMKDITPEKAYKKLKIEDIFRTALKDQGFGSKMPKDTTDLKKSFTDSWNNLSKDEKALMTGFMKQSDCGRFLSVWAKIQGKMAMSVR